MASHLEREFESYLKLISKPLLKNMVKEHRFHPIRRWRFDFAWPESMVALEMDGIAKQAGGGRHSYDGDREKMNMAVSMGWHVFRYSGKLLRSNPHKAIKMLSELIELKKGFFDAEKEN